MSATGVVTAVGLAVDLLTAVTELSAKIQSVNMLLQKAHSEGRDITKEELDTVIAMDDQARERLASLLG
jgi:anti-sigma factor ChrR (cupin superfamily)